ncbi:MAG: glycosyltransferase [Rhodospirillales bacterium]|nr:glycosyltransferase [Rhodospirillales bacterium]
MSSKIAPFFSLVTVTRNNLPGLQKTLGSVQVQTDQNFQWIVVDGASTDGTLDFLEDVAKSRRSHFPCTFLSEPDRGIYDAMNKGIGRACGDYVLFLNAGDQLAGPDVLKTIREAAGKTPFDIIYGDALEEREKPDLPPSLKPARSHRTLARGLFTHHQAIFYHSRALKSTRYNLSYHIASDYDLTARLLMRGGPVLYVPRPICLFERGGLSQRALHVGRREQFHSRAALGLVSPLANRLIYGTQLAASLLKSAAPGLYWAFRARRSSRAMAR